MQTLILLASLASCLLVLRAASPRESQGAQPAAPPGAPAPSPETRRLDAWVGTWDAEVEIMGETSRGTETCRLDCGGFWLVTEFTGSFMGAPFQGKGLTGYDASKSAYSGVWIDSTGGPMSVFANGEFSKDGKTFRALVDAVGMDGKPAKHEYRTTFDGARKRTFEIFRVDGGKSELQMRIRYAKK